MEHIPVLMEEVLSFTTIVNEPSFLIDGTFGRGGHSMAIREKFPEIVLFGVDQDLDAISFAKENYSELLKAEKLHLLHKNFEQIEEIKKQVALIALDGVDDVLLDLGVSSPQLDQAHRGFSFYHDGPLDMRMNQDQELSAAHIVNEWDESELAEIFIKLGEVRKPFRVVEKIVERRREKEFTSTLDLSHLIESTDGWRRKGHHPATNYFLALRLKVNDELGVVERALPGYLDLLKPGGRLLVITFHSLEDRIVKYIFKDFAKEGLGKILTKKVIQAKWDEKKGNVRARSAKLRVFEKGGQDVSI